MELEIYNSSSGILPSKDIVALQQTSSSFEQLSDSTHEHTDDEH
jgi:hypothetical protein